MASRCRYLAGLEEREDAQQHWPRAGPGRSPRARSRGRQRRDRSAAAAAIVLGAQLSRARGDLSRHRSGRFDANDRDRARAGCVDGESRDRASWRPRNVQSGCRGQGGLDLRSPSETLPTRCKWPALKNRCEETGRVANFHSHAQSREPDGISR
jgi:hypothetical protein